MKFIGEKLKKLRLDQDPKMTMEELARLAEVSQATISSIENDKKSPRLNTVGKFSEIFNINPLYFYIDEDIASEVFPPNTDKEIIKFATDKDNINYLKMAIRLKELGMTDETLDAVQVMITKAREVRYFLSNEKE